MKKSKYSIQDLCSIAILTAVTAVMAQISIPMPIGVPLTMQTFAVTLSAIILGKRNGMISMTIYILLGAVGVPVFANFGGGLHYIIGPTGGFLISFPLMAWLIGLGTEHKNQKGIFVIMLILGTAVNFIMGGSIFQFCYGKFDDCSGYIMRASISSNRYFKSSRCSSAGFKTSETIKNNIVE